MSTLYRDYRPQTFAEVLGQNHIKITLQNEIMSGKLAHAYLFCGPRAVGKTTLARILAKALNCENRKDKNFEPCNKCKSCQSITLGSNLDIAEIDAASNTGVDNVRENIIASARIAPQTKFKVFIIDEVHMLSISAFNALLKIIEEPPRGVLFILCTTEIHKVPATIISRCERFDFKRISVAEVVKKLTFIAGKEQVEIEDSVLEAVARQANGYMRDAESLLGQIIALGEKNISAAQAELIIPNNNTQEIINLLSYLEKKDLLQAIKLINSLVDSGLNVKNFTNEIISVLRKIIFCKINPSLASGLGLDFSEVLEAKVNDLTGRLTLEQWLSIIQEFLNVNGNNSNIFITQLPLELALINICNSSSSSEPNSTNNKISSSSSLGSSLSYNKTTKSVNNRSDQLNEAQLKKNGLKTDISSDVSDVSGSSRIINNSTVINLSCEELRDKWPEFLVKVKNHNHSLSFVLQSCQAREVKANKLCLVFKYKFHKDRINDPQVKIIVEEILQDVFGALLEVEASIDESLVLNQSLAVEDFMGLEPVVPPLTVDSNSKNRSAPADPKAKLKVSASKEIVSEGGLLGNLLQAFGGEVIN